MKKTLILFCVIALAGCVQVLTPEQVDAAVKDCRAAGGTPQFQTVNQYNDRVKWVNCYGKENR